ncbi:MAG: glycosyltransferase family A protein [Candidatus Atabeyarchaeum deiterrae]
MTKSSYSVCMTAYNSMQTIKKTIESIIHEVSIKNIRSGLAEIVVCDNCSKDGSLQYLKTLDSQGVIKLIVKKTNRGEGRQVALENSSGEYVIDRVDADQLFLPVHLKCLYYYIKKEKELGPFCLFAANLVFSRRSFMLRMGGWQSVQECDGSELYQRMLKAGKFYRVDRNLFDREYYREIEEKGGPLPSVNAANYSSSRVKLKHEYHNYRDWLRYGLPFNVFLQEHRQTCLSYSKYWLRYGLLSFAWLVAQTKRRFHTFAGLTWENIFEKDSLSEAMSSFEVDHPDKLLT